MALEKEIKGLTHLVMLAKQGDEAALEELYCRFMPLVLNHVKKMKVEYQQDAKSELLVELFEAIQRFEPNTDWGERELENHLQNREKK
ncbi:helix-turn-helix domain-containing protein [Alkalibacillus silvisoli]|uniref:Helix-turn-helix conjugative transposon-like domain-containing protein n=1 Tax=Alkalibacillus silvisoli TaxID=392823 RepID=A0ABP3K3B6_9BACI